VLEFVCPVFAFKVQEHCRHDKGRSNACIYLFADLITLS
jgi:hypothetical protein